MNRTGGGRSKPSTAATRGGVEKGIKGEGERCRKNALAVAKKEKT